MGSSKFVFRVDHEKHDERITAVSYGDLVRVLEADAGQQLPANYHVLQGVIPSQQREATAPVRYTCPRGKICAMCTGTTNCGGGPPPRPASSLASGTPGTRTILVKQGVTITAPEPGDRQCMSDPEGDAALRIPIFAARGDDLGAALSEYRNAARIADQPMAFHVYQITSAPDALAALRGKLIAIPVRCGRPQPRAVPVMVRPM